MIPLVEILKSTGIWDEKDVFYTIHLETFFLPQLLVVVGGGFKLFVLPFGEDVVMLTNIFNLVETTT